MIETGRDFSIVALATNADIVVQAVLALLALASIACWAIILEKIFRLIRLGGDVRRLELAAAGRERPDLARPGLVRAVFLAAEHEHSHGQDAAEARSDARARLEKAMRFASKAELGRLEAGLPFLATVGSAAPFVGLFGTVWGIMNSFTSIAQLQDTSLAVVAPGIAEALFATALGLATAIPAVVAYNQITVALGRAANRMSPAMAELARMLARLDAPAATAAS